MVKAGTCVHHKTDHLSDLPYKAGTNVYHMKNSRHVVYCCISLKLLALATELSDYWGRSSLRIVGREKFTVLKYNEDAISNS